ncbi:MAG: hypothetical protein EZS26_000929 [Candidatus Ordinivivax streblomastigis]|uniref:Ricin B lectin domain-containing protein n=1 Tax=Candidatus Ordinivivax streblomastigis TaxID=2540710 RepID=A0A5M8P2S2_9BACT|nr:MAG: hypothetical protein EZS26_000929 [Candidatus Ordinivivax streblomastigis]
MKKLHFSSIIFVLFVTTLRLQAQTQLTNLPSMFITTDDGSAITSKVIYDSAKVTIRSSISTDQITDVHAAIRGRGNSTWNMQKKPYRLKLDKKANLFGLPAKAKSWVLLANYADKTLMRNALAFKISETVEMGFTPSVQFLDLYVNSEYLGNYTLTDQMEVGSGRVSIDEMKPADIQEPAISGGYFLEIDGFADSEPKWFTSDHGLKITIKSPDEDEITPQQENYIKNYINDFETRLFDTGFADPAGGYRPWVDTLSLVNWYIACELTGNSDSFWSTYIYKKRNDNKLYFGPLWDFDIAFNNDNRLGDAVRKLMREHAHNPRTWIQQLWKDEWFRKAVERRWLELVNDGLENKLINYITETATLLNASQQQNFQKWRILNTRVYDETFLFPTYTGGVNYLKTYIRERIAFLTESFVVPEPEKPTPPFVAENFYYIIMNKRTNNAIDVTDESLNANALLMLWVPKEEDDSQLWKIEAVDNTIFRFINKRSGLIMTANGRGNNLIQTEWNESATAQKWKITPVLTGGLYGIESTVSPYYSVNNNSGSFENGNKVMVWDNNITGSENQQWYIQKRELIDIPSDIHRPETLPFRYAVSGKSLYMENVPPNAYLRIFNAQGVLTNEIHSAGTNVTIVLPQQGIFILHINTGEKVYSTKIINN